MQSKTVCQRPLKCTNAEMLCLFNSAVQMRNLGPLINLDTTARLRNVVLQKFDENYWIQK